MIPLYDEVQGDLVKLAQQGRFDVIAHGCNCFCTMGAGLAPQMAKAFGCDRFPLEHPRHYGDPNKLGQIDYWTITIPSRKAPLRVVNCYTQFNFGKNHAGGEEKPLNYAALELCLYKINYEFEGLHVGLPQIGCHLAGGDWNIVKTMIKAQLKNCRVTVVIYKP